jgi:TolB-like protein/Flp pilus assembly protein TadD
MADPSPVEPPSRAQIEEQLARLLASESFSGALRSQGFLRFIVGEALAGRQDRLGGYTIGVEVFERSEGFDPQTDPIVRVEAGRLRRRLEHYYLAEATDDAVLIEVPKGHYVPTFSDRVAGESDSEPRGVGRGLDERPASRHRRLRGAMAALILVLVVALGLVLWRLVRPGLAEDPNDLTDTPLMGPRAVVVLPFDYAADAAPHPFLAHGLVEELISMLAALPDFEVVALGSAKQVATDGLTPKEIGRALQVDYVIRGNILQERARLRVTLFVVEASNSLVRLSRSYDATLDNVLDLQTEIARDIAESLAAAATPAFENRLRATGKRDPEVLALYHQAGELRHPPSDPVRSRLAEGAYRRVIELDPEFAGGYAGLAYVLAFRSWWGLSEQPDADVREATEAARLAIEKDPEYGWGHMNLSIALNVIGDHDGSLNAARLASRLAPSDPNVLSFAGIFQAFAGEVEAAIPLVRSAIRLDPLSVRTPFRNVAGVVLFHAGRFEEALEVMHENVRMGGPDGPHMAYYRAGALARLGRVEEAQAEIEKASAFPYEFDMRNFLGAFRDPREARELWDSLESIGLDAGAVSVAKAH